MEKKIKKDLMKDLVNLPLVGQREKLFGFMLQV